MKFFLIRYKRYDYTTPMHSATITFRSLSIKYNEHASMHAYTHKKAWSPFILHASQGLRNPR